MQNKIDQSHCKNCGICTEVCPNKIIGKNDNVYFKQEREHLCLQCGQCMAACPTNSVHVKGLSYENDFNKLPANKIDYKDFIGVLATCRSVRNFKKRAVSDELIIEIVNSVSYAPFGASPEKMEISIINNRKTIESALPLISFLDWKK